MAFLEGFLLKFYKIIKAENLISAFIQVPWVGIEPTLPKKLDFESSASTNSATKANGRQK